MSIAKTAEEWIHSYRVCYQCLDQDILLINAKAIHKDLKQLSGYQAAYSAHESFKLDAMKSLMSPETLSQYHKKHWTQRAKDWIKRIFS